MYPPFLLFLCWARTSFTCHRQCIDREREHQKKTDELSNYDDERTPRKKQNKNTKRIVKASIGEERVGARIEPKRFPLFPIYILKWRDTIIKKKRKGRIKKKREKIVHQQHHLPCSSFRFVIKVAESSSSSISILDGVTWLNSTSSVPLPPTWHDILLFSLSLFLFIPFFLKYFS